MIKPLVNEVLQRTDAMIMESFNKKVLQDAENKRTVRREEELRKQTSVLRRIEIRRQLDGSCNKVADKLVTGILPTVVEMISETEAQEYVKTLAAVTDNEAWNTAKSESEIVHDILSQVSVPEIVKRIEIQSKSHDQLAALIAAHDAFEFQLKNVSFEESKIICESVVKSILNEI